MHWADVLAKETAETADEHVLATAITPSGAIHVGNMREVLTTEMVARSLRDVEGAKVRLIYIADSYDPLRKVYPFLDPNVYKEHVGRPLAEIPCPCGDHASYSEHFLEPFLAALDELGVEMEVLDAYDLYKDGRYKREVETAMAARDAIRGILEEVTGRRLPKEWIPFNVQCPECGRLDGTRARGIAGVDIEYGCACGNRGHIDVSKPGAGKLPWRIDWPARWNFLGVTFEAMGKDHAASGGSWDTGVRLVREVFGSEPPSRTVYEFIQLKGAGAMHSSKGTGVSAEGVLRMTPPEVLRFFIARNQPNKHLDFDPGLGLLDLVDEYDEYERAYFGAAEARAGMKDVERTYELSQPRHVPEQLPHQEGYRHLATVVQIGGDYEGVLKVLGRGGLEPERLSELAARRLRQRVEHVRYWLERFAPDNVRFTVHDELPDVEWSEADAKVLAALSGRLADTAWQPQPIHDAIHETAGAHGLKGGRAFQAVYKAFLAKGSGPRAGFFLASLDRAWVLKRLEEAAAAAATG